MRSERAYADEYLRLVAPEVAAGLRPPTASEGEQAARVSDEATLRAALSGWPEDFVVRCSDDGVHVDGPLTQAELIRRITPNGDGESYYGWGFLDRVPDAVQGRWSQADRVKVLIIKGAIVVPEPVATVTTYKVP